MNIDALTKSKIKIHVFVILFSCKLLNLDILDRKFITFKIRRNDINMTFKVSEDKGYKIPFIIHNYYYPIRL